MSTNPRILWADDEIELLRPHVLFLEEKGYDVDPVVSGVEAVERVREESYDVLLLDENMPGLSGLETLRQVKSLRPGLPVVMITKNEEEHLMEQAIGAQIADYILKPINPKQILLSLKKLLDARRLVTETTTQGYQQAFQQLGFRYEDANDLDAWAEVYKDLVYWELELAKAEEPAMAEVFYHQKSEAGHRFAEFVDKNYADILESGRPAGPYFSHEVFEQRVFPFLETNGKAVVIVIDNLRYDQWKVLAQELRPYFFVDREEVNCSILPTTTSYARNSLFAGLLPAQIAKQFPKYWREEGPGQEGGLNEFEAELLQTNMDRKGLKQSMAYRKVISQQQGKAVTDEFSSLIKNDLIVLVYNFVDLLSHARSEMAVLKELAGDEAAYRSLTRSWFEHSSLLAVLKRLAEDRIPVILTTDHGTVRVKKPVQVVGERDLNPNLRFKYGKRLGYDKKDVIESGKAAHWGLPDSIPGAGYLFAREDTFLVYPNNYNQYAAKYRDSFQHGGVSLEEMLVPYVELRPR